MNTAVIPILTRRLLLVPILVLAVMALTYALTHAAPGDPVKIIAGARDIEPQRAQEIREEFGLEGNYLQRFSRYVWGVVSRGDLGPSYYYRSPVRSVQELLGERIWVSAQINLIVMALVFGLGIPIGVYAAVHRGRWQDPAVHRWAQGLRLFPSPIFAVLLAVLLVTGLASLFALFGFNVPNVWTPGDPASYILPVLA